MVAGGDDQRDIGEAPQVCGRGLVFPLLGPLCEIPRQCDQVGGDRVRQREKVRGRGGRVRPPEV